MTETKRFQVKDDTRKRCKSVPYDDKTKSRFSRVSLEFFGYFYQAESIDFSLYVRVDNEAFEFMRPNELSKELLDQIGGAAQKDYDNLDILVLKSDKDRFDQFLANVRDKKVKDLMKRQPDLDPKVLSLFSNLSSASQMIVRGGINSEVVSKVKQTAAFMVNNLMDSDVAIDTLSRMVICDPTLYDHSASVAMIAAIIGNQVINKPLNKKENEVLSQCALYHDVGKTCVPNAVLNKPGKFTPEEFEVMKKHTLFGYEELIRCIDGHASIDALAARVALEHHEKFDGKGYPHGRKGRLEDDAQNGIHLYSRIVTIADIYSALLMKRVYKPAYESQDAIKIMAATPNDYDPLLFLPFLKSVVKSLNTQQERLKSKGRILFFDDSGHLQEKKGAA